MVKKKVPIEQLEGAINVSGDITPITRTPITKVTPERWREMSVSELHSQREVMCNRYYSAIQAGLLDGAKTIQAGIMTIDDILEDMGEVGPGFLWV